MPATTTTSRRRYSRRRFLAGASAAVTAPYFIPAASLGRGGVTAPSNRFAVGIIGMGGRGGDHANDLLRRGHARIVAVCDAYRSKAENWKARIEKHYAEKSPAGTYEGCQATQDWREVVAREDIDAVVIASPENWHALQSVTAMRAGKDVYCEKALALTVREGRAVCDTVRRYNRVFQIGTQQRSAPEFLKAAECVRNGHLGKVAMVRVAVPGGQALPNAPAREPPADIAYDLWLGPAPYTPYNDLKCTFNWYFMSDYCAGWIESWGVHHLDSALWGMPQFAKGRVTVEGTADFPSDGAADTSTSWRTRITTAEGEVMSFCSDNQPEHEHGIRFIGDKGWIHVKRGEIRAEPSGLLEVPRGPQRLYESGDHMGNFLECMRSRRETAATADMGHAATTLALVADIATRLGRRLTWDWDRERFIDDASANRMLARPYRSPWRL